MQNVGTSAIRERLREARVRLERLDRERAWRGNPLLDKVVENRILWRELLDLELWSRSNSCAKCLFLWVKYRSPHSRRALSPR